MLPLLQELAVVRRILFMLVGVTLLIVGGASMIFVHAALRPLDRIARIIRRIRPDDLSVRVPVPHTRDEVAWLAETFNDLVERLERSFNAQRQIVQDISHELKTPLTVARGEFELALKKNRTEAEYRRVLHSGLHEIERIRGIVHSLLTLARLDSDKVSLEMKPVDLQEVIRSVSEDLQAFAASKGIRMSLPSTGPVIVSGDPAHLKRLLANLLENAVKYTPASGRVDLGLARSGRTVTIDIKDTGIGIAEEDLPHIFDRFYRSRQRRVQDDGFGLGLSIARSIVDLHEGRIEARSSPGEGAHFHVELPAHPVP